MAFAPPRLPSQEDLFAHTPPVEAPSAEWQRLEDHLMGTASLCRTHLEPNGLGKWGHLLGWLHDLGKASPEWQSYLRKSHAMPGMSHGKVDHKLTGALWARKWPSGFPLSAAIAGHHGGLFDEAELRQERLSDPKIAALLTGALKEFAQADSAQPPELPAWILHQKDRQKGRRSLDVFTRLLFSALVDADYLDTETYYAHAGDGDSKATNAARCGFPPLEAYLPYLESHLEQFKAETPVQQLRSEVLEACKAAGTGPRGSWSLTVPTGGGKTLSSLAWALRHAEAHGLRRVVVALPFTSIIDQTAQVFRQIFAPLAPSTVLEHHSNLDPKRVSSAQRVAAENWAAPLIVTTQVQLFESLFSAKPSVCRKLHQLQDSVIILDEVQSLPRDLLAPILDQLNEWVSHYGVSLLLMTATQPSLGAHATASGLFPGFDPAPREIIPENLEARLWDGLRRVETHWPGQWEMPEPSSQAYWSELAERILAHPRALAICHLKRDAQALFEAVREHDPRALHLSASMCPAHRRAVLRSVRQRLKANLPCRLISTQVVEAGVDIDFPVVFRAMAGLESLAQSAGRCNREGRLEALGQFFVFEPPTAPPGVLKEHCAVAQSMLTHNPELDIFSPATFPAYFAWLHEPSRLDARGIQPLREELRFKGVDEAFQMIPSATTPIFIPLCSRARRLLERLRWEGPSRDLLRALQPYSVSVYDGAFRELASHGAIEVIQENFHALYQAPGPHYDSATGFRSEADATLPLFV